MASHRASRSSSRNPLTSRANELPTQPISTAYSTVRLEADRDNPRRITVFLDDAPSSFIDLDDPLNVGFEYMNIFLAALNHLGQESLNVTHLGSAGSTMARAINMQFPSSRQIGVDIDGELIDLARTWFDLPRSPALKLRAGDARAQLETLRDSSQDVIIRDVFARGSTPRHLTTSEFMKSVLTKLRPGGIYLANCADKPPLSIARQEIATMLSAASTFDDLAQVTTRSAVALTSETAVLKGRRFGNLVLLLAKGIREGEDYQAYDVESAAFARALRTLAIPAHIIVGDEMALFAGTARVLHDPLDSKE